MNGGALRGPSVPGPREARARARAGTAGPTAGWAPGHAQANLIAVPADWAYDVLLTDRACRPAGRLRGPMVVSMRPVPARLVPVARRISGLLPAVHGAPVHAGDPAALGIRDLDRPDFGDPVVAEPGDVPVFWACGVTPQAAVVASRPPFAITHAPGRMFVTDVRDEEYRIAF
ncbi:DUF1445 domain-containing protein [Streptomyces sp. NPDC007863]|uniref:D-glutamate cyclase family protein n=1 Tax=Streptomyces sp. NPDC007863 TaxID=3154894 RepID=UPI0033D63538